MQVIFTNNQRFAHGFDDLYIPYPMGVAVTGYVSKFKNIQNPDYYNTKEDFKDFFPNIISKIVQQLNRIRET